MSRKLRVRVNHLAAKTVNACSASNKESLAVTTAVMIFSRCAAYAGYKSNFGSLFFLSSIPFLASATILVFEIYTAIKGSNSSKKSD